MYTSDLHYAELFEYFSRVQQRWLSKGFLDLQAPVEAYLEPLLRRHPRKPDRGDMQRALLDPYFPLGMLQRTLFAEVDGMRFYINKLRSDLETVLAGELESWCAVFLQIRHDIRTRFDPTTITCIPLDGKKHPLPDKQWCTFCGVCCQIGGLPPEPPADVRYPDHWNAYLSGRALDNQQMCPFLFQYFGEPRFFCAIHHVKPAACRQFDEEDCRQRLSMRGLHREQAIHA
jgi:hypothetical protein